MANIDAKLKVSELDFDTIKQNLRTFLQSQTEFSDYNFEGSGLSVLLDVLAYNTHYMGYYLNMVANEMFIDSAISRPSVVSHAKLLGYTPRSRVASQALVDVSFQEVPGGSNSAMTIPRFTRFATSAKDGINYTFVNVDQRVASRNTAGYFNFTDLIIKEGQPLVYTFVFNQATNAKQVFELPDIGIDTSTIQVQVQTSALNATLERFELVTDLSTQVSTDAAVYYLEENRNGKYQIYFGDNIIGKALVDGNIVIVTYIVTSGTDANGIRSFRLADNIKPGSPVTITVKSESFSGKKEEDIDSIKFVAPKSYIAQNRAVTKNDYIALLNKNYPYFDSVTVWGGEENNPPQYGKIFFSAKPRGNYEITQTEIEYVKEEVLSPISILTVTPEYVPADYNYLVFKSFVTYDQRKTSRTAGEIQTVVYNAIINFSNQYFNTFNGSFKISRLIRAIDDADPSIQNNLLDVFIEKRFRPKLGQAANYTIDFNVPLLRGTSIQRLTSQPSFVLLDDLNIERESYLEEIPQSFSGVESIEITNPGSGYTDIPDITINGDGEGAEAAAIIVNGTIRSIRITKNGSGYTSAIVTITGGGGVGARAIAIMEGKIGKIRSYYYDSNLIKTILNNEAGIIYYDEGRVELLNFKPISVNDAYGTMTLKSFPATNAFSTKRNCILTLDNTDPTAIEVQVSNSES
jgi:hypothetical protein